MKADRDLFFLLARTVRINMSLLCLCLPGKVRIYRLGLFYFIMNYSDDLPGLQMENLNCQFRSEACQNLTAQIGIYEAFPSFLAIISPGG